MMATCYAAKQKKDKAVVPCKLAAFPGNADELVDLKMDTNQLMLSVWLHGKGAVGQQAAIPCVVPVVAQTTCMAWKLPI